MVKKADFINVIFESTRGSIQASELMGFMNLFATSFDEVIGYGEFMGMLAKVSGSREQQYTQDAHQQMDHMNIHEPHNTGKLNQLHLLVTLVSLQSRLKDAIV